MLPTAKRDQGKPTPPSPLYAEYKYTTSTPETTCLPTDEAIRHHLRYSTVPTYLRYVHEVRMMHTVIEKKEESESRTYLTFYKVMFK